MTQLKFNLSVFLLFFSIGISYSQKNDPGSAAIFGSFTASTPCSINTRPLPGIPVKADCELIKWRLTFYQDERQKIPTTFALHCVYGLPKQGTTGFINGGQKLDITGKWTIVKGTASNPYLTLHLTDDKTKKRISFLQLNDNLLQLLDSAQHLMVGTAAWSYTLNRISNK